MLLAGLTHHRDQLVRRFWNHHAASGPADPQTGVFEQEFVAKLFHLIVYGLPVA
jgi:hypothetical protein